MGEFVEYVGGAGPLELVAGVTDNPSEALWTVTGNIAGWPNGASGRYFVAQAGLASDLECERLLCEAIEGTGPNYTLRIIDRNWDGTAPHAHEPGTLVYHVLAAETVNDLMTLMYDTEQDFLTQYLNPARHANETLHRIGTSLPNPGAPAAIGTAAAAGSSTAAARSDHVHRIGAGAIDASALFAPEVIVGAALVDGAIDDPRLFAAGVIDSAAIDAGAVGETNLDDDAVSSRTIADGAIDSKAYFGTAVRPALVAADAPTTTVVGELWTDTDTLIVYQWDGTSWTQFGLAQPGVTIRFRKTSNQEVSTDSWFGISWAADEILERTIESMWNLSSPGARYIVFPWDGLYQVNAMLHFDQDGDGYRGIAFAVGDTFTVGDTPNHIRSYGAATVGDPHYVCAAATIRVDAGDRLVLAARANTGTAAWPDVATAELEVVYLGA